MQIAAVPGERSSLEQAATRKTIVEKMAGRPEEYERTAPHVGVLHGKPLGIASSIEVLNGANYIQHDFSSM
jgi:hypothetical protein